MPFVLAEHIRELREEISEISKESSEFLRRGRKDPARLGEQERRLQRLQEIKDELASLSVRKTL